MNQQMFTCQNCGGMRFAPGVPYQYAGQLCNCPNPAMSQMGLSQPMQQQPMNMSNTDYQILQTLGRIETLLIKLNETPENNINRTPELKAEMEKIATELSSKTDNVGIDIPRNTLNPGIYAGVILGFQAAISLLSAEKNDKRKL